MRALDAAKARLDALSDRNAILDCFFEFGRDLFQFSILFIVREGTAHGRKVHGLGAPDDLVANIALPLNAGPGILRRVRELRRPFVTSNSVVTEADARLFGSIGRAMPAGVVVPLVLRDRVVAVFLGDGPAEPLQRRGAEIGRPAVDLAKDEMMLWGEAVSTALERLILRRKSLRPPGFGSVRPPPMPGAAADEIPVRLPPPGNLPVWNLPGEEGYVEEDENIGGGGEDAEGGDRSGLYLVGAGIAAALLIASGVYMWTSRAAPPPAYRTVTAGAKLAGWPKVDPLSVLDPARAAAAGAGAGAELSSIQAEIGPDARVDFGDHPKNNEDTYLTYVFVTPELEIQVRVDSAGVQAPATAVRKTCGDKPCRGVVTAPPHCSFAQIRDAAVALGLKPEERALVTYADRRDGTSRSEGGPRWSVAVVDRGSVQLDAATCKPLPRERLFPAATPIASLPGAPHDVEPMTLLPIARTQSGLESDAVLLEIEARGVSSAGKLDLTGDGGITFTFGDPASVPAATRRWREVIVDRAGMHLKPIMGWEPMPSRFTADIMPPVCTLAHAFKGLGPVTAGATATIRYGRGSGAGESGEFDLLVPSAALHRIISDAECAADEKLKK